MVPIGDNGESEFGTRLASSYLVEKLDCGGILARNFKHQDAILVYSLFGTA